MEIDVNINDKGILSATANSPITKISVQNEAGNSIKEIDIAEPASTYSLDLNNFPQGKITIIFYTTEGEQSFTINN